MVARLLWEQDAAGSSPVTSTKVKPFFELRVIFRGRNFKEGKQKKAGELLPGFSYAFIFITPIFCPVFFSETGSSFFSSVFIFGIFSNSSLSYHSEFFTVMFWL